MKKINFKIDAPELQRQIELARQKITSVHHMEPVVTTAKLSENSEHSWHGFHFEKKGKTKVGQIQYLEDGSIRRIEKILGQFDLTETEADNWMISEFMGWCIESRVDKEYTDQEWHTVKNKFDEALWDSAEVLNLDVPFAPSRREDLIAKLTKNFVSFYGKGGNYSTNWVNLMPVVAKITKDEKYIGLGLREAIMDVVPYGNLIDTHEAVVSFLKWLKTQ